MLVFCVHVATHATVLFTLERKQGIKITHLFLWKNVTFLMYHITIVLSKCAWNVNNRIHWTMPPPYLIIRLWHWLLPVDECYSLKRREFTMHVHHNVVKSAIYLKTPLFLFGIIEWHTCVYQCLETNLHKSQGAGSDCQRQSRVAWEIGKVRTSTIS